MKYAEQVDLPSVEVSQSPEEKFREYLASRPRPQRFTEQQRDMIRYIFSHHNHFDAEQLNDEMKREGLRVSRATVYRTLPKLVEAGLLRELDFGQRKFYEHDYGYPQHDHLHCEKCDKKIEFLDPQLEDIIQRVCRQNGFQLKEHSFVLRGLCAECHQARSIKHRLDLV